MSQAPAAAAVPTIVMVLSGIGAVCGSVGLTLSLKRTLATTPLPPKKSTIGDLIQLTSIYSLTAIAGTYSGGAIGAMVGATLSSLGKFAAVPITVATIATIATLYDVHIVPRRRVGDKRVQTQGEAGSSGVQGNVGPDQPAH